MFGKLKQVNLKAAAVAGLSAGAAYVATMEIDNRLTRIRADDLKLLGRPFVKRASQAKLAGVPIHIQNSIALAVAYAAFGHDRLPGPPWLRGVVFTNIENTLLYPALFFEQLHPGIRDGEIDPYFNVKGYLQSVPRHIAYGIVVGVLYDRLSKKG